MTTPTITSRFYENGDALLGPHRLELGPWARRTLVPPFVGQDTALVAVGTLTKPLKHALGLIHQQQLATSSVAVALGASLTAADVGYLQEQENAQEEWVEQRDGQLYANHRPRCLLVARHIRALAAVSSRSTAQGG